MVFGKRRTFFYRFIRTDLKKSAVPPYFTGAAVCTASRYPYRMQTHPDAITLRQTFAILGTLRFRSGRPFAVHLLPDISCAALSTLHSLYRVRDSLISASTVWLFYI